MLDVILISFILLPLAMTSIFLMRDHAMKKRDRQIEAKCADLERLFYECGGQKQLTRIYLQSSGANSYPYDLFMLEYTGGAHVTDTIWLPTRHFLYASDETIKKVLIDELANPGKYTIKDWQEAVYQFIKREIKHKKNAPQKKSSH